VVLLGGEAFVIVIAAVGWLYWLRAIVAHWPGPKLGQALPLDALSSRDTVPLVVFVVVFALAGALIGRGVRRSRFRRVPGVLCVTLFVWVVLYGADTVSLFTVRQIPFLDSLRQALSLVPAYLAAALAGVAAALAGATART
jgi:uncharacterized membrane protein AbrB (regulator of aidB expression)